MTHKIVVLAGDGVGPEVIREGLRVLEAVSRIDGFSYRTTEFPYGTEHYLRTGELLPDTVDTLRRDPGGELVAGAGDSGGEADWLACAVLEYALPGAGGVLCAEGAGEQAEDGEAEHPGRVPERPLGLLRRVQQNRP